MLASAVERALGAVILKFKNFKNARFTAFSKVYSSHVIPVMDYSSGIWGIQKLRMRTKFKLEQEDTYYMGVHQKPPIFAIQQVEIGCVMTKVRHHQVAVL